MRSILDGVGYHSLALLLCVFCRDELFDASHEFKQGDSAVCGELLEFFGRKANCAGGRGDFAILCSHLGVEVGQVQVGLLAGHVDAASGLLLAGLLSGQLEAGENVRKALLVGVDAEPLEFILDLCVTLAAVARIDESCNLTLVLVHESAVFELVDVPRKRALRRSLPGRSG